MAGLLGACTTTEEPKPAPPGPGGGLGTGLEASSPEAGNNSASGGEPFDELLCHEHSTLSFDVGQSHRTASATYAFAAVESRAWPGAADMSQLQVGDFVAAFDDPKRETDVLQAGFLPTTEGASEGVLFVFPPYAKPEAGSLELFIVVDTTASMRNELELAGRVVERIAAGVDALEPSIAVTFGVAALGTTSEQFATLQTGEPLDLAKDFTAFLNEKTAGGAVAFKDGQLGPFVGLDALDAVASSPDEAFSAMIESAERPHVLVLTDGGFAADEGTVRTIDTWTKSGAHVSFAQLYAPKPGEESRPTSFRGDLLTTLAARGGGASLFVTKAQVDASNLGTPGSFTLATLPNALLGPAAEPFQGTSDDAVAIPTATPDGFEGVPGVPATTWVPRSPAVSSLSVSTCGVPPTVTIDGHALPTTPSAHLELIAKLVAVLQKGCQGSDEFVKLAELGEAAAPALQTFISEMGIALQACD